MHIMNCTLSTTIIVLTDSSAAIFQLFLNLNQLLAASIERSILLEHANFLKDLEGISCRLLVVLVMKELFLFDWLVKLLLD